MALVYEGRINLPVYYLSLGVIAVFCFYELYTSDKGYSENLDKIDNLLKQVEIGEPLPSLKELREKKHKT
jgi:hypothetical protein